MRNAPGESERVHAQTADGVYRAGYETLQNERFARLQTLGVLPSNAVVAAGMPAWDDLSPSGKEAWATEMATYAAMIEIMDDGIGQLIQVLKDNNQYDNTLILVLSDRAIQACPSAA